MGELTIVNVLPHLLGTYGDAGNELALAHRLTLRGIPHRVVRVQPGDAVPTQGDIYLLGGGEDRAQPLAVSLIGRSLADATASGAVVLGVCAGLQILGTWFTDSQGERHEGLGLVDMTTVPLRQRAVGEAAIVLGDHDGEILVGFENHRGGTHLGAGVPPLGRVLVGSGNGGGVDGVRQGRILGTYLHGPVLALNPSFADSLLALVTGPLEALDDRWERPARDRRLAAIGGRTRTTS